MDTDLDNIQQYFGYKATHGRKDGNGGLSPKTLRLHKNVLQLAFKEAMRHKLIRSNPCELVRLPNLRDGSMSGIMPVKLTLCLRP